ncbi:hypothetical protein [Sulfuriferula nivalis]|uniref:Uncharacterized protein n=1 Tax=Sulfuriferula nivalis TaxID=2675298 RepID=A0A809RG78_9PROT|nr:hypothetical protein [Sulfuriferula nivalis]BBP00585.1 hypothetical protein SFSGTM_12930 [Sulfuriferula nivalis]
MSINGISSTTHHNIAPTQLQTQKAPVRQDSDGDNDKSKVGEVEKASSQSSGSSTIGNKINTSA